MNKFDEAINYVNYMNETYLEHTKYRRKQKGLGDLPYKVKKALKKAQKQEKLLELYKELSYIRFLLFCETDPEDGQRLMDKDIEILKQIKELENE